MQVTHKLYGAILGDIAGSPHERPSHGEEVKYPKNFVLHPSDGHFTDDTVMTLAAALYLCENKKRPVEHYFKLFGVNYPNAGYGQSFKEWTKSPSGTTNNSWGNGCLMRASPFMYIKDEDERYEEVINQCLCSHMHPRSIIATGRLFQAYKAAELRRQSVEPAKTRLDKFKKFDVTAMGTMLFVEKAYTISNSTHETMRQVIECGGDTDTNACIVGELMNYTFNDVSNADVKFVNSKLDDTLRGILQMFNEKFK